MIVAGSLLLMSPWASASGVSASLLTAFFTATSAVCVTGLAVVDTGTYWSGFGQGVILALLQLGGFGMMASASLLGRIIYRRMRLRSQVLVQAETHSLALGDSRRILKLILGVTVVVELIATLWLSLRFHYAYGMDWPQACWQGLFHAVSAFNNAGFSTWGDSLTGFGADLQILAPVALAIIIGGLGFPVLYELIVARPNRYRHSLHTTLTLWGTAGLLLVGTIALLIAESGNPQTLGPMGWGERVLAAAFASVSARTAGFNTIDMSTLTMESLALHYLLMFIGGGSAGTAGGVKVTTFLILLLIVWSEIRGDRDVEFDGRRVSSSVQRQALTILVLSAGAVSTAVLVIIPMTTLPFEKVLFEVISAYATVGLSTGITAQLPPAGQTVLIVLMFVGRVGIVTFAAAMAMKSGRRGYRYPKEKAIVG